MRIVSLLVVVAIIYVVMARRGAGPMSSTQQAMKEADAVMATPAGGTAQAPAAPPAANSGMRAPIDRTRSVLEQVKKRNGAGDF